MSGNAPTVPFVQSGSSNVAASRPDTQRGFELPRIDELSKEQEDARALPKHGQHLIIGGPGTGKSVLALIRSRRHHLDRDDYVFLVYNRLLNQSSRLLFGTKDARDTRAAALKGTELRSAQWQSWFAGIFVRYTNSQVPRLLPGKHGWRDVDWDGVEQTIAALPASTATASPFLIIDEGQDMPPAFYQALVNLGFENFYVVADQNQQIVSGKNSTRQDIQRGLGIETSGVIELHDNYRNTYPIARLAREFYTGNPASPPPALPNKPSAVRPLLYEYAHGRFETVIRRILKTADNNPKKLIGVIAPDNDVREKYCRSLQSVNVELDHGRPRVETYHSGANPQLRFDQGGILVVNAQSCKGLEFDTVFLADIHRHRSDAKDPDRAKRLFYVMVARAKDHVIMLKEQGKHCPVEAILPKDTDVLERK